MYVVPPLRPARFVDPGDHAMYFLVGIVRSVSYDDLLLLNFPDTLEPP
jgi:hypothetical protein